MGISLSALMLTDEEIRDSRKRPAKLEALLKRTIPFGSEDCCCLHDFWAGIDYVLTRGPQGGALPMGALRVGDVMYTKGLSDPAHAIFSATTRALARELDSLGESTLRERFDPKAMLEAGVYPGRLWTPPAEASFIELKGYLRELRDFAAAAADRKKGLVFSRYEDL